MKLAILGSVGVPGRYGGFETLAENLVRYAETCSKPNDAFTVYCSARAYVQHPARFLGARLRYSRLAANGVQSIPYDVLTSLNAVARGHDTLLFLGVSGSVVLPLLRLFTGARIVTNVDGIEWRRDKWRGLARSYLRWSEALAVRYSHAVIADNQGIADYLRETHGAEAEVIAYGGDHALQARDRAAAADLLTGTHLPMNYALALCRIEPENNVEMILEAFDCVAQSLVFVGNWNNSDYGRALKARFDERPWLHLVDPVYQTESLYAIRARASVYVHGHSAGGTNPALVEMMHFGIPVLAFDCNFNRYTTEDRAAYFDSAEGLRSWLDGGLFPQNGSAMFEIAQRRYSWDKIGRLYFALIGSLHDQ